MSRNRIRQIALCSAAVLFPSAAFAQFFPGSGIDPCAVPQPITSIGYAPVASTAFTQVASAQDCVMTCQPAPLVPVAQTCYQTVPVTEYQSVKRTVERPVVETRYVDQEVTAYRPITESRVAEVPTVSYSNVTEYQTVTRDVGRWVTHRECIQRPTACQIDGRPGFLGWFNRTGYQMRSAFSPTFRTRREYVPNVVAQVVPVTRQVAHHGTRQVTYNVTQMEPYKTTRKVAVNSVRMVAEEVNEMRPVTVMRSVPIGTRMAYVSPSSLSATASRTALGPFPDPAGARSAATTVPQRTADSRNNERFNRSTTNPPYDGANPNPDAQKFQRDPAPFKEDPAPFKSGQVERNDLIQNTSLAVPASYQTQGTALPPLQTAPQLLPRQAAQPAALEAPGVSQPPVTSTRNVPSIVRVSQWSRRSSSASQVASSAAPPAGPALPVPTISVAGQ